MKILLAFFILSSQEVWAKPAPLKSKEEIRYTSKEEEPLLDITKGNEFLGTMERQGIKKKSLRMVDLYDLKDSTKIKLDQSQCDQHLAATFGDPQKISLKLKSNEVVRSPKVGYLCEAVLVDEDPMAFFKERRFLVANYKNRIFGLVFRLPKEATSEEVDDIRNFVSSLRRE